MLMAVHALAQGWYLVHGLSDLSRFQFQWPYIASVLVDLARAAVHCLHGFDTGRLCGALSW